MASRSIVRTFHLILGLGGGLLVVLTGLTGAGLAFRGEIDRALNPSLWRVEPRSSSRTLEEARAAVEATGGPAPRMILVPDRDDRALMFFLADRDPSDRWEVFVDPHTAKVLGRRRFGSAWTARLHRLHVELLAGTPGRVVVGTGGLISLALGGSGLVLWWRTRSARKVPLARWTALDLHRRVGILGLIPSTILAISGALLIFRPYVAPVLNLVTGPMPLDTVPRSRGDRTLRGPSPDQIRDQALRAHPDARLTRLYFPEGPDGTFAVRLRFPEDGNPHGNTAMRFDRYSGELRQEHSSRGASRVQRFVWYAAYPWHTGDALGLVGPYLVALTGLLPAVLLVTGIVWWRRRVRRSPARISS